MKKRTYLLYIQILFSNVTYADWTDILDECAGHTNYGLAKKSEQKDTHPIQLEELKHKLSTSDNSVSASDRN